MAVIDPEEQRRLNEEKYRPIDVERGVKELLQDLRAYVENQGTGKTRLINGIYQTPDLDTVQTTSYGPWEFGYQVKPVDVLNGLYIRNVYVKIKGCSIEDVPTRQLEPIMGAVTEACIDLGNETPEIDQIADDCFKVSQRFAITFMFEKSPNIVTPGKVG